MSLLKLGSFYKSAVNLSSNSPCKETYCQINKDELNAFTIKRGRREERRDKNTNYIKHDKLLI